MNATSPRKPSLPPPCPITMSLLVPHWALRGRPTLSELVFGPDSASGPPPRAGMVTTQVIGRGRAPRARCLVPAPGRAGRLAGPADVSRRRERLCMPPQCPPGMHKGPLARGLVLPLGDIVPRVGAIPVPAPLAPRGLNPSQSCVGPPPPPPPLSLPCPVPPARERVPWAGRQVYSLRLSSNRSTEKEASVEAEG